MTLSGSGLAQRPSLFILEAGLTVIALAVATCWPGAGARWFAHAELWLGRLARRRALSVLVVGATALLLRLAILPWSPIPQPFVHDEFANLLAADTFASGRLTNPTHPMWIYFESFHITHQPTYMSMYFPGQGLVMAAGKVIFGNPWFGVWLSAGLMCAAICWMLQAWLPPQWALLGGMLAVLRLALFSYWIDDYHGGAVAAIGGALTLGALPRIQKNGRIRDGLWMVLGLAILANSRAWEGFLLAIPVACSLMTSRTLLQRVFAPAALLAALLGMTAYYNHRVFGSALTLPYQINRATYASSPVFLWQKPRPEPIYRYRVMRNFYTNWELRDFLRARTLPGFLQGTAKKAGTVLFFFFGIALFPPLIMLPRALRDRRVRFLVIAAAVTALGLGVNAWLFPHYLAPFTCALLALFLQAMRHLRVWRPAGLAMVRTIPVLCVALAALRLYAEPLQLAIPRWPTMWYGTEPLGLARAHVLTELETYPGRQLAIVRYAPEHLPFYDWVYNAASIDAARVVWARESEQGAGNQDLLDYFEDRKVWLIEPDATPPRISPYQPIPNQSVLSLTQANPR